MQDYPGRRRRSSDYRIVRFRVAWVIAEGRRQHLPGQEEVTQGEVARDQALTARRMPARSAAAMVVGRVAATWMPVDAPATRPRPATETLSRVVLAAYIMVSAARMMF